MSDVIYSPSTNYNSGPGAVGSSGSSSSSSSGSSGYSNVINSAQSVNYANGSRDNYDMLDYRNTNNLLNYIGNRFYSDVLGNNNQYIENANSANAFQMLLQKQAQNYNSLEANKNRSWQEYMSNTAHVREVQDLINAGLNPVLSALTGSGATTPTGASASSSQGNSKMADVDKDKLQSSLLSILATVINSSYALEIADKQAETAVKTANINSAATRYSADKGTEHGVISSNVKGLMNQLFGLINGSWKPGKDNY